MALMNFFVSVGIFYALRTLSAGVVSVLLYMSPAYVCIFFMITKIKPVSRLNKVAVLLSIGGCCLALNVFNTPLAELSVSGILFGLLACVAFGSYQLVADLKLPGDLQQLSIITVGLTVGGIVGSIINPSMYIRLPQLSPLALGLFLLSVVMTKIVPLLLEVRAISIIGSERASVILSMEVPWTLLLAYFTLGETMLPSQLAGVGLVVLSVILLQKIESRLLPGSSLRCSITCLTRLLHAAPAREKWQRGAPFHESQSRWTQSRSPHPESAAS